MENVYDADGVQRALYEWKVFDISLVDFIKKLQKFFSIDENYPYEHDLNNNGELDAFEFFKDNDKTNFFEGIFSDMLGAFTFLSLLDAVFENIIDFGKELNLPFDVFD